MSGLLFVELLYTLAYVMPSVLPVTFIVQVELAAQSLRATLAVAIHPPFIAAPAAVNATVAPPVGVEE